MSGSAGQRAGALPSAPTSFVGRTEELAKLTGLLAAARLVTVVGPGGVGKTRLALQAAAEVEPQYPDGVFLIELSMLPDPDLLAHVVAEALWLQDQTARPMVDVLCRYLTDRRLLLVLDTCEPVAAAVGTLCATLLTAAPGLTVLATSRQVLGVLGEQLLPLAPLRVPRNDISTDVARVDAVALFSQRAAAVAPGFALTAENQAAVVELCRRLDGIPLAIELAAVQLRTLSVSQLEARLDDGLELLSTENRAAPRRHQTLRAAIGWSHELCEPPERLLWARLSVFPGGFDLEAVAETCADDQLPAPSMVEVLTGLVHKSIVLAEQRQGEVRYRMLDTVREYGLDWLRRIGEQDWLARRHRDYYLRLAERFDADWFGPRQLAWTHRMRAERDNLCAALGYCLASPAEAHAGVRLAGALDYFWVAGGNVREGRYWLERVLAADPDPSLDRLRAMYAYSAVLYAQGEKPPDGAELAFREAERWGDPLAMARAVTDVGLTLWLVGDPVGADRMLSEALVRLDALGVAEPTVVIARFMLAITALQVGDPDRAAKLLAEAREICRHRDEQYWQAQVLNYSSFVASERGDVEGADAYLREWFRVQRGLDDPLGAADALERLAWNAAARGDYPRAARLLGAADGRWRMLGQTLFGFAQWQHRHDEYESRTREALGDAVFEREFRHGAEFTVEEAMTLHH